MFGMSPGEEVRGNWRDPVVIAVAFLSVVLAAGVCYLYFAAPVQVPQLEPGYRPLRLPAATGPAEVEAVEQFRAALRSDDANMVLRAAVQLQYLPVPQLKDDLLALKDRGFEQAWVSVLPELYALGWEPAVDELREYLLSPAMEMTTLALMQLKRMPPLTCAEELEEDLNIPHDAMTAAGSQVLRSWGQTTPSILRLLKTMVRGTRSVTLQLQSAMALVVLGEDTDAAWSRLQGIARSADLETGIVLGRFLRTRKEPEAVAVLKAMLERNATCLPALAAFVEHEVADKDELLVPYRRVERANWFFMVDVNLAATGKPEALEADLEKLRPEGLDVTLPLIEAMGEWHGLEALRLYQELALDAARPERVAMAHNARWYPWNPQARALVRGFLEVAVDEDEVRHELRTLGLIGNASDIPLLRKYLRVALEPETRMMAAWGILNISRGLPVTRASQVEV